MLDEKDLQAIAQLMDQALQPIQSGLSALTDRLDRVEDRSQKNAVLLETEVDRKLDLLYEGHDAIMERLDKLASKSRVEELENEVSVLKLAIRSMNQEIAELKKAQGF